MAYYKIEGNTLQAIADSIRAKTGGTAKIAPGDMPTAIAGITTEEEKETYEVWYYFNGDAVTVGGTSNVKEGSDVAAAIVAKPGYKISRVAVTISHSSPGGAAGDEEDITESSYKDGIVYIPNVTGHVTVFVFEEEADVTTYTGEVEVE